MMAWTALLLAWQTRLPFHWLSRFRLLLAARRAHKSPNKYAAHCLLGAVATFALQAASCVDPSEIRSNLLARELG